jgi:hypothetical protein
MKDGEDTVQDAKPRTSKPKPQSLNPKTHPAIGEPVMIAA